jgi:hypothetical protein
VRKIAGMTQEVGVAKNFHVVAVHVVRAFMQDPSNNLRQGVLQVVVQLRGTVHICKHTKTSNNEVASLFFEPVNSRWQQAMGLDVSGGDAGACSVCTSLLSCGHYLFIAEHACMMLNMHVYLDDMYVGMLNMHICC